MLSTGSEQRSIDVRYRAWQVALLNPLADVILVVAILATVLGFLDPFASWPGYTAAADFGVGALTVVGLLIVIGLPILMFTYFPYVYYQRILATRFPDGHVLVTQSFGSLRSTMKELALDDPAADPHAKVRLTSYLVVEHDRLTFWGRHGTEMLPYLSIPRSRVDSVTAGTGSDANGTLIPIATISLRKGDGETLGITLQFNAHLSTIGRIQRELNESVNGLVAWQQARRRRSSSTTPRSSG